MSLQVWLPLNGDLHNQGLSNNIITNTVVFNNNGKIGSCLESTSLLDLNVPQSIYDVYSVSNTEISYCLWIKIDKAYLNNLISTTDFSTKTQIYNKIMGFNTGTTSNGIGLHLKTNAELTQSTVLNTIFVYGWLRNGSVNNGSAATEINLDQWYHLCVTYDKLNVFKFYINGSLIASKTINRANLNTSISDKNVVLNAKACELANSLSQNAHLLNLKEYINDVRIYDHALSQKEVEEISKGLVLWYQLNSTNITYSNIYDSSGYRNNGTIIGSLITSTGSPRYLVATNFSDFTNYITTPSLGLTECSYSMWVRPSADTTVGVVFSDYLSGMCFGRGESYVYCHHNTATLNPNKRYIRSTIANDDTWQHFVICRTSAGEISLYKNGELVSPNSTSVNGFNHYETDQLLIGRRIGANQSDNTAYSIKGDIVDFREYATILTPAQVKELYLTSMIVNANGTTSPRELVN